MPTRMTPSDPVAAARLAVHDEQIRTLQRERKEDREAARESMEELKEELLEALKVQLSPLVEKVNTAKATAEQNDRWIRDIKLQGGAWALALLTMGGAIFAAIKLLWTRVHFQ